MFCSCVSIRWVSSWVLYICLMWSYGSSKRYDFNVGLLREILAWGGDVLDVSVFLLVPFSRDLFLWFFWRICYLSELLCMNNGTLKVKFLVFHHVVLKILSRLCCWFHIQDSLLWGMGLMRSRVFDRIWVNTVDYFSCGFVDADLFHSDVEMYCQNSGWQWVQSWNGMLSCLYLL